MRLLLSSDALPDADFGTLATAVRRRAFEGLELAIGEGQTGGRTGFSRHEAGIAARPRRRPRNEK
ncbi:MAG: hypothetical protein WD423_16505 [Rhodothermales bacterium]